MKSWSGGALCPLAECAHVTFVNGVPELIGAPEEPQTRALVRRGPHHLLATVFLRRAGDRWRVLALASDGIISVPAGFVDDPTHELPNELLNRIAVGLDADDSDVLGVLQAYHRNSARIVRAGRRPLDRRSSRFAWVEQCTACVVIDDALAERIPVGANDLAWFDSNVPTQTETAMHIRHAIAAASVPRFDVVVCAWFVSMLIAAMLA